MLSLLPPSWWARQQLLVNEEQRKAVLQPLLLCGTEPWQMGSPAIHKFAKYLVVANDHIRKEPFLDMYTAAKAITPIYSLGLSLEALKEVKGADSKLRALYRGPSAEIDSTIFELLVAAAFASKGHDVAFIEENAKKKDTGRVGRRYGSLLRKLQGVRLWSLRAYPERAQTSQA